MGSQAEAVVFCVEDTVGRKDDGFEVGVVDRSFRDVDSHAPQPERDYSEGIDRDPDVPHDDFQTFLRTGVPPRGTALVSWQTEDKAELIPETKLQLIDRNLFVGDVVKRSHDDSVTGTVIGINAVCSLFPQTGFDSDHLWSEDGWIRNVPAAELVHAHEIFEGSIVAYDNWIGRVDSVYDDVTIRLSNNSVVVVENPDELENTSLLPGHLSVGDSVVTKKGNLRRGRWRYGAFDPNIKSEGVVVDTQVEFIHVRWLMRGIFPGDPIEAQFQEPPTRLYRDELDSPGFFKYDASPSAAITLPRSADGKGLSFHLTDLAVGDRVRFKDLTAAVVKYGGPSTLPDSRTQGKLTKIPRTETLGYDMNVFIVMHTSTEVTVQWQDLTISTHPSQDLVGHPVVSDDDDVWPGEIVWNERLNEPGSRLTWSPAKVGVVQAVKSRDRTAVVRWFENPIMRLLESDLIQAKLGKLGETIENISLYDLRSTPSLKRRRGDIVLIHPDALNANMLPSNLQGPNWFGEIIDLGLDGRITVRLGAANPIVDVQIPTEQVTLAYGADMDADDYSTDGEDDATSWLGLPPENGGSVNGDDPFPEGAAFENVWFEYEEYDEAMASGDDGEWSTEDEDDLEGDDDDPMSDIIPSDQPLTSDTTPEAHSTGQPKSPSPNNEKDVPSATEAPEAVPATVQGVNIQIEKNVNGAPEPLLILDTEPPSDHHFLTRGAAPSSSSFMRRVAKEHKILRNSLPSGIFVRTWEGRLDLLRVLMIGPSDTPYEFAPFVIDLYLGGSYPHQPPSAFFHSWTDGKGPINPNLYEDGKICLSLLGTWHADQRNESWNSTKSTLLQVLVSIMGLVLVRDPYYNEAGYDVHRETPETKFSSALYVERAYFRSRGFIAHALTKDVTPFADELKFLYRNDSEGAPRLLHQAIQTAKETLGRSEDGSEEEKDGLRRVTLGATVMLKRQVERLESIRDQKE